MGLGVVCIRDAGMFVLLIDDCHMNSSYIVTSVIHNDGKANKKALKTIDKSTIIQHFIGKRSRNPGSKRPRVPKVWSPCRKLTCRASWLSGVVQFDTVSDGECLGPLSLHRSNGGNGIHWLEQASRHPTIVSVTFLAKDNWHWLSFRNPGHVAYSRS